MSEGTDAPPRCRFRRNRNSRGPGHCRRPRVTSPGTTLGPTSVGARATVDWFVAELASDNVGVRYAAPIRTS
jgi:hypothetical protein